jgi:hypothetical protein
VEGQAKGLSQTLSWSDVTGRDIGETSVGDNLVKYSKLSYTEPCHASRQLHAAAEQRQARPNHDHSHSVKSTATLGLVATCDVGRGGACDVGRFRDERGDENGGRRAAHTMGLSVAPERDD